MKVRITSTRHVMPIGTVLEVGDEAPKAWAGQYEIVASKAPILTVDVKDGGLDGADPLDHDRDGKKGGNVWRKPKPG